MNHSTGPSPHQERRTVPKNSTLERIADVPCSLNEVQLEEVRARVRSAVQGLDPATRLYLAVSALVGDGTAGEIAVTHPGTGDIVCYITPPVVKLARDIAARSRSRNDIPNGTKASLDDLLHNIGEDDPDAV